MSVVSTNLGALSGLRILDLSRILAGPSCTQLLGDFGAEIIKVERPKYGDDTRKWGPPYLKDDNDEDLAESAYYLCCNRNKKSITVDISQAEGQQIIMSLLKTCDVMIENYKAGDMHKYGLSYEQLKDRFPRLVYCSITGFGQDGPDANRPGYDFMIQAMGGIMSVTGPEHGSPHKVGVGIADIMCGMYASNAIQAALLYRQQSGEGQYIDCALFDTQLAWHANNGQNYLTSGEPVKRYGNGHPNIVPYDVYPCKDQHIALAIGNDEQFTRFCTIVGLDTLATDPRFSQNAQRVVHRKELTQKIQLAMKTQPLQVWLDKLNHAKVPCGPVNTLEQAFDEPQALHRKMRLTMAHPQAKNQQLDLIANPVKFSKTPVSYRQPPPALGEHTTEILNTHLDLSPDQCADLIKRSII